MSLRTIRWLAALAAMSWAQQGLVPAGAAVSIRVNRVLQVPAVPGQAAQNCQGLRDALAPLTDGSAQQPYVVLLEPGNYGCGATTLSVPRWVTLQGIGGRTRTTLSGSIDSPVLGVVHLTEGSQVRGLTVLNSTHAGSGAIALSVWQFGGGATGRLREVRLVAGQGANAYALQAIGALVEAEDAILAGPARGDASDLVFRHSVLASVDSVLLVGDSSKLCIFTRRQNGTRLDEDCEP